MEKNRPLFVTDHARNFAEALAILEPLVLPLAWKAQRDAVDDIGNRIANDPAFQIMSDGQRAQFLRPQIVHNVKELLKRYAVELPYNWYSQRGMDVLSVDGRVSVCFKKLDRALRRSNYATPHNEDYWNQSGLELPLKLIVGYTPNATWSDAKFHITLPTRRRGKSGGAIEWQQIPDQTERCISIMQSTVAPTVVAEEAKPSFSVRARNKQQSKSGGRSDVG